MIGEACSGIVKSLGGVKLMREGRRPRYKDEEVSEGLAVVPDHQH